MTGTALAGAAAARAALRARADPEVARGAMRYFKTGPGEYGEGDTFIGVRTPAMRRLAREYRTLPLDDLAELLRSPVHEERGLALMILVWQFARGDAAVRERIHRLYLDHTRHINNWDLVDLSAPGIVGEYMVDRDSSPLLELARSELVWERRIAMLATLAFIRRGRYDETLRVAELLLGDRHDLIHKAAGWMLREVGKRDRAVEEAFLRAHCRHMPRTMLRYAIERFPPELRSRYLRGNVD